MPETGLMLAVGGLLSFKTEDDLELQRSSVTLVGVANELDDGIGFGVRSKQKIFFNNDDVRYFGHLDAGHQSLYYWGVGYDAGKAQESSDELLVDIEYVKYNADLTFRVYEQLYVGPILRLKYFSPSDDLPDSAIWDPNFNQYKDLPLGVGLGAVVQWDSRDVAVNARKGHFFNLEFTGYSPEWGSDSRYQKALLDYRYYYTPRLGSTFAFLNRIELSDGDVPYYDMAMLGGMDFMRGTYMGHFRDLNATENTFEYRHTFADGSGLSRHGVTAWIGAGSISDEASSLYQDWIVTYGVGYRYELQPRMNVRADLGFSSEDEVAFISPLQRRFDHAPVFLPDRFIQPFGDC
ncbi:membrane protein [Vibrio ishigakensis]|uniref:Membrane protein n=1 Tax=Vibrio ishigakensis TaxID=1481914 RepID=A0A0B8P2V4_9VIBR|nr:membrane protein [Vibrio ishigakensis]